MLNNSRLENLTSILLQPIDENNIAQSNCFDPHHAIIFYHKSQLSYIDMCFHCWGLRTSEDLDKLKGYDMKKWEQMLTLFKQAGFKYEIPGE